jgi:glycosyltransferase involved in cell wall biosynthesis
LDQTRTTSAPVTVVIPYLDREKHLNQALEAWFQQKYTGHIGIVVVDFSDEPSSVDLSRVRLLRPQDTRWNPCRARNLGARNAYGTLLIFTTADFLVDPEFIARLMVHWDDFDMWVAEGITRRVPYDPTLEGLVAVKRWVHTRLRGFHEPLMENPHGWGYECIDYRLRAEAMLKTAGCSIGDYLTETVAVLLHSDEERSAPYDAPDLRASYQAHEAYSAWYRQEIGWEANRGQDWGQVW